MLAALRVADGRQVGFQVHHLDGAAVVEVEVVAGNRLGQVVEEAEEVFGDY